MKKKSTIKRVPILDPKQVLLEKCKEKLEYLNIIGIANEDEIMQSAFYYGYKVRELYNLSGFNAISKKDPFHHKNFKYFAEVCNLCIKNNWDIFIYIDSQFDRAEYWENSDGRVYPQQLCSERAIRYYSIYIKEKTQEHEADGTTFKSQSIKSVDEEILKALMEDCLLIKNGIEYSNVDGTLVEKKLMVLFNNWISLSPYYLSTSGWLLETAQEYAIETKNTDTLKTVEKVKKILSNNKLRESSKIILEKIESKLDLPETPSKEELIEYM